MKHNVKDYGAVGDGQTSDRDAFRRAIEAAKESGGYVEVPAGEYYVGPDWPEHCQVIHRPGKRYR